MCDYVRRPPNVCVCRKHLQHLRDRLADTQKPTTPKQYRDELARPPIEQQPPTIRHQAISLQSQRNQANCFWLTLDTEAIGSISVLYGWRVYLKKKKQHEQDNFIPSVAQPCHGSLNKTSDVSVDNHYGGKIKCLNGLTASGGPMLCSAQRIALANRSGRAPSN